MVKKDIKVLAVIPARGGSKGLPGKNIKLLAGHPLICYMIKAALSSNHIDRVCVSTDSDKIAQVAKECGAEVPFLRPKELASDTSALNPVLKHAVDQYDSYGFNADIVISLQPTSPLITSTIIDTAIELFLKTNCDSVVTITEIKHGHPYRAKKLGENSRIHNFCSEFDGEKFINRQERPPAYAYNGAIYLRSRALVDSWSGTDMGLGTDCRAVIVKEDQAVNIDDAFDFRLAELLIKDTKNENSSL